MVEERGFITGYLNPLSLDEYCIADRYRTGCHFQHGETRAYDGKRHGCTGGVCYGLGGRAFTFTLVMGVFFVHGVESHEHEKGMFDCVDR